MISLHAGTTLLTLGIASLAIGVAFFGLNAGNDGRAPGSNWSLAAICQGAAWILLGTCSDLPAALPVMLANVLLAANAVLLLHGAVHYMPAPAPWLLAVRPWAVLLLLAAAPYVCFSFADDRLRTMLAAIIRTPLLLAAIALLYRHAPRNGRAILCTLFGIDAASHALGALAGLSSTASIDDLLCGALSILVIAAQFRVQSDNAREALQAWAEALEAESLQLEKTIEERNRELLEMASTDFLTGIANRRQFISRAEQEIARARRYGHRLSLLMIDIDHFKSINDRFGHATGDLAIIAIGRHCATLCRRSDLAGRLGGEEFAIVLPATAMAEAKIVAERLRAGARKLQVMHDGGIVPLRLSIGIACLEDRDDGPEALLARADQALYAAKNDGRDCVRYA